MTVAPIDRAPIEQAPFDALVWKLGSAVVGQSQSESLSADSVELLRTVQARGLKSITLSNWETDLDLFARRGLVAARCLFIDDNKANIATAKSLGFVTHRFTEAIRLRAFFYRVGVMPIPELPEWKHTGQALQRSFTFDGFGVAWAFMQCIADAAEQLDHHPDWSNSWNKVDISLTTHDRHAVTHLDYALAYEIERILECS